MLAAAALGALGAQLEQLQAAKQDWFVGASLVDEQDISLEADGAVTVRRQAFDKALRNFPKTDYRGGAQPAGGAGSALLKRPMHTKYAMGNSRALLPRSTDYYQRTNTHKPNNQNQITKTKNQKTN